MPNTFPDVPFDESLFEANELMREYWNRSTENRVTSMAKDSNVVEPFMATELLELHEVSKHLFESSQEQQTGETQTSSEEAEHQQLHVVDAFAPEVPTHEAIVKTLTVSEGSSLSAGAVIAIIIITLLVLYLIIVAVVPRFTGSMRD